MLIHYNNLALHNLPDRYIEKYSEYLKPNFKEKLEDWKQKTVSLESTILNSFQSFIDRTETIEHYVNIKNLFPVPKYDPNFSKTWETLCNERAQYLLSQNKIINVFWSGGLDSTNLLMFLIANAKDRNQIVVQLNYNSIIESGYIFDTFIKPNVKYNIDVARIKPLLFNENEIYVTGNPADQISYVDANNKRWGNIFINKENMNIDSKIENHLRQNTYDFMKPSIDKYEKKIETVRDLLWFVGFNYRWQNACLCPLFLVNNTNLRENYSKVVIGFYDNDEFQQWSMADHERDNNPNSKIYIRKSLMKLCGDNIEPYAMHKQRTPSFYVNYNRKYLFTTDKYENIYMDDELVSLIYGGSPVGKV